MKLSNIIGIVLLTIAVAYATVAWTGRQASSPTKETAYQRVMRTGTLRCGYVVYPKFFDKDPNTQKYSGIVYDITNEIGKQLNLKIEWTEEIGTGNMFEGLMMGRYDAICSLIVLVPARLRVAAYTLPYAYMPYYIYVRESDHRFDNQFDKINDPSVKVAYLEGEMGQKVKEQDFPNATSLSLQNMTGFGEVSLQVATGKADIAMGEPAVMDGFIEKNPGKIRQVSGPPVRMQGAAMQVGVYEHELQGMLDGTLAFLRDNGFVARTFDKYLGKPGHYYFLPSEPWEEVPAK